MSTIELRAEPRSVVGKKVRFLRRQGVVPGNLYGHSASAAIQVNAREAEQTIRRAGRTQLISLAVKGAEPATVLVKTWQRHPFRGDLLHVDFYRIAMTETLRMDVPLRLTGEAPAVKATGGTAFQPLAVVSIECLPGNLPEAIDVDISGLDEVDASIFVRDLVAPDGVTITTDGDEMVVKILAPTVEQPTAAEEAAAEAAGETAPEASSEAS